MPVVELFGNTVEGFLQPFIWNFILAQMSVGKLVGCCAVGLWGLFFFNDDGEMQEKCLRTGFVGAQASYYSSE